MKNLYLIFIITLIIITGISVNTVGQTKTATDKSEKIYMNKKGEIRDHGWNKIGFITKDNIVKNSRGKNIFFIDRNGSVIDVNGKNSGKAQKNGNYFNVNGENIITVRDINAETCEILDPKGHSMGTVHRNYKLHACAAHCLALTKKNATK